jgi:hypothetical protein
MSRFSRIAPWLPLGVATVLGIGGLWLEAAAPRNASPGDPILVPLLLAYAVAGGLIGSREPRNAVGWLLSLLCIAMVGSFAVGRYAIAGFDGAVAVPFPEIGAAFSWTWILALSCPVLLAFVVPTGRPLSRSWARAMAATAAVLAMVVVIFALGEPGGGSGKEAVDFANPLYVPALRPLYEFVNSAFVIYVALFALGAAALTVRFRRSRGVERQQLKWVLLGMVAMLVGITASNVIPARPVSDVAWIIGMLVLPVALAIAIGRHRLYDIDLVIKRTVSYGALSIFLVGIEIGGILLLQELLSGFTGSQNYAVAATTLGVAALFQPARRRIQGWVDRRFDRDRYDLEQVADGFGSRLRDRMDLVEVESELVAAASGTLRPTQAWVWVRERSKGSTS